MASRWVNIKYESHLSWKFYWINPFESVLITIVSSNINEVVRAILNSFIQNFHNHKQAQNAYGRIKIKNAPKNIQGENSHLFAYLRFCTFARVSLCRLVFLVLLSAFSAISVCEIFLLLLNYFTFSIISLTLLVNLLPWELLGLKAFRNYHSRINVYPYLEDEIIKMKQTYFIS